jgi:hypothetical protein
MSHTPCSSPSSKLHVISSASHHRHPAAPLPGILLHPVLLCVCPHTHSISSGSGSGMHNSTRASQTHSLLIYIICVLTPLYMCPDTDSSSSSSSSRASKTRQASAASASASATYAADTRARGSPPGTKVLALRVQKYLRYGYKSTNSDTLLALQA